MFVQRGRCDDCRCGRQLCKEACLFRAAGLTNCAFDPRGRYGLLVTEAAKGTVLSFPDLGPGDAPVSAKQAAP